VGSAPDRSRDLLGDSGGWTRALEKDYHALHQFSELHSRCPAPRGDRKQERRVTSARARPVEFHSVLDRRWSSTLLTLPDRRVLQQCQQVSSLRWCQSLVYPRHKELCRFRLRFTRSNLLQRARPRSCPVPRRYGDVLKAAELTDTPPLNHPRRQREGVPAGTRCAGAWFAGDSCSDPSDRLLSKASARNHVSSCIPPRTGRRGSKPG
jgi:hypothetical protein